MLLSTSKTLSSKIPPSLSRLLVVIFLLIQSNLLVSQVEYVIVDSVHISGNKRTQRQVILREIDLHPGDTIGLDQMAARLSSNEKRLQSTGLFSFAKINIKEWNTDLSTANVDITLQENWYLYPYAIFELADRNFNVWSKEQNYSLSRVNYGVALTHANFTGRKDKLKLKFQRGYTHKYEIDYDQPYVSNKWGLSTNFLYSENREIAYSTEGNKLLFYKNPEERKLFYQHRAGITVQHRTSPLLYQRLRLEYLSAVVDTAVSQRLNGDYFLKNGSNFKYFQLDYELIFDKTLYPLYPMGGYKIVFNARKNGLGIFDDINTTWATLSIERHTPVSSWCVLSNRLKYKRNLQANPIPYYLNRGLGYANDDITGYQLYVLDAKNYFLSVNAVRFRILDRDFIFNKYMPKPFRLMNTKAFVRLNFDLGYTQDPSFGGGNALTNNLQYGYGPGIDVILYNLVTMSAEIGITRFGEKGLFFETNFNF